MRQYDLICIGSGPAGEKAATQAAYFKRKVAIVECNPMPGGAMVNTGTIPSKALRETSLLCSSFRRRPIPGLELTLDHELTIPRLMAQRLFVQQQEHDRIESSIDRHGIDVYRGWGRLLDPHRVKVDLAAGDVVELNAEHILIATGSSPARPAFLDFRHPGIVDADGILEVQTRPKRMLVVGGGVIGTEYACMFAELGVQVTLVHPGAAILGFIEEEIRERLLAAMADHNIEVRTEVMLTAAEPKDDQTLRAELDDGSTLDVDTVLWALGRQGNTRNIGLEDLGIEPDKRGCLEVNEHYQTREPSVYAAGDVIGFPALAATSMEQGRVAACHMFGINFKTHLADVAPIGLYTIPPIASVGMSEQQAKDAGHDVVIGRATLRQNVRGRMLGDEQGLLRCIFDLHTHELLGAAMIGEQATELIHLAQFAITQRADMQYFIDACFNYPSLSELYKYAAYNALQQLAEIEHHPQELGVHASTV